MHLLRIVRRLFSLFLLNALSSIFFSFCIPYTTEALYLSIQSPGNKVHNAYIQNMYRIANLPYLKVKKEVPFSIFLYKSTQKKREPVAGLLGVILGKKYTKINTLWVAKNKRKQGLGTRLMHAVERYAIKKGCKFLNLSTFSFQARPFYEKLGFTCIGTIPNWMEGYDFYFMQKNLW